MKQEISERIDKINRGIVPEGYKETKLGIIPEDWEINNFNNIFQISGGMSYSRKKMSNKGIPCLHYGDIHSRVKTHININKEYEKIPKINIKIEDLKSKVFLAV